LPCIGWDEKTSTATIDVDNKVIKLTLGSKTMLVDNSKIELDVAPELINGRTFVPLRAVSEALQKQVFFYRNLIVLSSSKRMIFDTTTEQNLIEALINEINVLPTVNTYENLKTLLEKANGGQDRYLKNYNMKSIDTLADFNVAQSTAKAESTTGASSNSAKEKNDFSSTNVQVQGVDESDVVKTDG
jgi:hypothetical protein